MARRTLDIPAGVSLPDLTKLLNDNFRRLEGLTSGATGASGRTVTAAAPLPPSSIKVARDGAYFAGSVARTLDEKAGEHPSFLDFGAVGDGVANDQPAIQAGLNGVAAAGGGAVLIPGGYTFRLNSSLAVPSDVHLVGQGETSIILRGAAIADGKGLLHLGGGRNLLRDFVVEGDVTTAAGLQYGVTVPSSPGAVILTKNTSIWVEACADVVVENIQVRHTGGYAILLDARTGDVSRCEVIGCTFRNNRPHKFGSTGGDLEYGSWTGGILGISDGASFKTSQVTVSDCAFARGTGNQVWTWLPAFSKLHSDWIVAGCTFVDIGRDCVLLGGIINGVVSNNSARRIGYMTLSDGGASTPKYLVNHWAVAFDTSGLARACSYTNNSVTSVYGGAFDLDGFSEGVVDGNTGRTPVSGEPEYTEDSIAAWATTSYGINLGDTSANSGGDSVLVTNNYFKNMGAGGIRLYAWRRGLCTGNLIDHPAAAVIAPIVYGPGGAGVAQAQGDCVVTGNTILYAPSGAAAIVEDATLASFGGAVNHVFGNRILGAAYEFYKHASSGSTTSMNLTTASAAAGAVEEMRFQVEGTGAAKALKLYAVAAATVAQVMSVTKAGQANFSDNGAAGTGAVMLGNVSSVGFGSTFAGRHFVGDGFIAMSAGAFSSSNANSLDDSWLLIRPNPTLDKWEQSVTTAAGARVWTDFGSGGSGPGTVPGANTEVLFNDGGAFGADAGFVYDKAANRITLAGSAGAAGFILQNGWMDAAGGFVTASAAANAIQAPSGGVTALSHVAARNDGASGFTLTRSSATARTWGFGIDGTGQLFVRDETAAANRLTFDTATGRASFAAQVVVGGAAAGAGLLVQDGYAESTEGFYSPFTSYQTFQAPSGGMFARSMRATAYTQVGSNFGAPAATAGDTIGAGAIYYDTAAGAFLGHNGVGFAPLAGGVASVSSLSANLTASPTTGAVNLNFSTSPTFAAMTASGAISAGGVVTANGGFNYTGFADNGIQAQSGGVAARTLNIANGFGGWQLAVDASRNHYGASYKATTGIDLINSSGKFVGLGVDVGQFFSVEGGQFNQRGLFGTNFGRTVTISLIDAFGSPQVLIFRGGILTAS
jgi:hypothetical protein